MGLFGHDGHLSKIGHKIGHVLDHYDQVLKSHGSSDIYVGASYGANGVSPRITSVNGDVTLGNTAPRAAGSIGKPSAYSRNTARTANDIAQGGMTKDEVVEFNMRHPNETAGG